MKLPTADIRGRSEIDNTGEKMKMRKTAAFCSIVFAALVVLFMASAMAGNASNDRSMNQDDCRSCHLVDQTSPTIHHALYDEENRYCTDLCHTPEYFYVTDCKVCHVDEQRDQHKLPGSDCAYCHGASVAASAHRQATAVHPAVTGTCFDCHSIGNQAQGGQSEHEAGSQNRRGR